MYREYTTRFITEPLYNGCLMQKVRTVLFAVLPGTPSQISYVTQFS